MSFRLLRRRGRGRWDELVAVHGVYLLGGLTFDVDQRRAVTWEPRGHVLGDRSEFVPNLWQAEV